MHFNFKKHFIFNPCPESVPQFKRHPSEGHETLIPKITLDLKSRIPIEEEVILPLESGEETKDQSVVSISVLKRGGWED